MVTRLVCESGPGDHAVRDACSVPAQANRPACHSLQETLYAMDHPDCL